MRPSAAGAMDRASAGRGRAWRLICNRDYPCSYIAVYKVIFCYTQIQVAVILIFKYPGLGLALISSLCPGQED